LRRSTTPDRLAVKKPQTTPNLLEKRAINKVLVDYQGDLHKLARREEELEEREQILLRENAELRQQVETLSLTLGRVRRGQKEVNEERFMFMKDAEKKQRDYEELTLRYQKTLIDLAESVSSILVIAQDSPMQAQRREESAEFIRHSLRRLLEQLRRTEAEVASKLDAESEAGSISSSKAHTYDSLQSLLDSPILAARGRAEVPQSSLGPVKLVSSPLWKDFRDR
jgi:uncharacterized protein YhaN